MDDQRTDRAGGGISFRKLRITWSVAWGVVIVLLAVLWVRSYWRSDFVGYNFEIDYGFGIRSSEGRTHFVSYNARSYTGSSRIRTTGFYLASFDVSQDGPPGPQWGFAIKGRHKPATYLTVPHWSLLLVSILLVSRMIPLRRRFSLRTLLIAMTLVAVGLGVIVWAVK
jgi:hypothetical protein